MNGCFEDNINVKKTVYPKEKKRKKIITGVIKKSTINPKAEHEKNTPILQYGFISY